VSMKKNRAFLKWAGGKYPLPVIGNTCFHRHASRNVRRQQLKRKKSRMKTRDNRPSGDGK
ncbi:hypothetical protein O5833_27290, partial [Escherichia coli]|nr:hypothetical protein [Escherichia coli]